MKIDAGVLRKKSSKWNFVKIGSVSPNLFKHVNKFIPKFPHFSFEKNRYRIYTKGA
jgi:hypothetical protein